MAPPTWPSSLVSRLQPPSPKFPAKDCFESPQTPVWGRSLPPAQVLPSREGFREILELAAGAGGRVAAAETVH